jgi:protein TonB
MGGVLVNPVKSIPIPNRGGRENPVANDTKSLVPTPPPPKEKTKPAVKEKVPPPNAVAIPNDRAPKKTRDAAAQPNKFREAQQYPKNQLYSDGGPRASSAMYQVQGGGSVGLGDSSPFGEQFGPYANIIRDNIARNWHPSQARTSTAPSVTVTFTIQRDGTVKDVKVSRSSGIQTLDFSAQRAVLDASPLPALPQGFPRNQADVELKFQLGN